MKKLVLAAAIVAVAFSGQAIAGNITVSATESASTLADHSVFTVSIASDSGPVNGVDISFNGAMNQVNPFTLPTIFQDNNAVLGAVGADASHDSQFLFAMADVLSLNTDEGGDFLRGALTNLAGLNDGTSIAVAQLVIPAGGQVSYQGVVDDGSGVGIGVDGVIGGVVAEPMAQATPGGGEISLQGAFDDLSGQMAGAIMVMTDIPADPAIVIEDLVLGGPDAALFDAVANGDKVDLSIDIDAASKLPAGTAVSASLQVLTTYGGDFSYTLTAVVPEPSTFALAGLALVGFVGFARRNG